MNINYGKIPISTHSKRKTNMNPLDQIDEHQIIRETVGYYFLKDIQLEDIPEVMKFLKIIWNYKKINSLNKQDI